MKWFLEEKYPAAEIPIEYGDSVFFIGSCFSQNIYEKGKRQGFMFDTSEHGTIFHPLPIARIIREAIKEEKNPRIVQNQDRYFSFDASSKLYADSPEEMEMYYNEVQARLKSSLKWAKFLFLTFGTAKGYAMDDIPVVANCHKIPASKFRSEITELHVLVDTYKELIVDLKKFNPDLNIVLTVSPVRHAKDGLITNNRSKARLLMLCEELEKIDKVSYFPAYELVVDQLRDYRFFTSDLIHPNSDAINYVWNVFEKVYFSDETMKISEKVGKFRSFFEHIPIHAENEQELALRKKKQEELRIFRIQNLKIMW